MEIGLSAEISAEDIKNYRVIFEISKNLEGNFKDKNYGEGIKGLFIGIICVRPEFEFFLKPRIKYSKKEKMLEYDIKLEFLRIRDAEKGVFLKILFDEIMVSLKVVKNLKIKNFDLEVFERELNLFFIREMKLYAA